MEVTDNKYQNDEIDLVLLAKKMLSYKALMAVVLIAGVVISLIWGLLLYTPSYDFSVSYTFTIPTSSTYSNLYGVQYKYPEELIENMKHTDTASAFLLDKGIGEKKLSAKSFLKPFNAKYEKEILSVSSSGKEDAISLYEDYIAYCVESFDNEYRSVVKKELMDAKSAIEKELEEVQSNVFENENANSSNYSYSITLQDRIKSIDIQLKAIEEGVLKVYSAYDIAKSNSRAKTMVIIVLIAFFIGAVADFLICFSDRRIYYSDDVTSIPSIRKKLPFCIPLYRGEGISKKESINVASKLPESVSSVSITEVSPNAGGFEIAEGLKAVAPALDVKYNGSLIEDADILSDASKYDLNLIVLRIGINKVNQVSNIIRDFSIKGIDNYYFVLYGLDPSDKMVTLFEDKSHYVKYPFYSFRTLRQHYEHYYKKA